MFARSTHSGNAKASNCRTSNKYGSHAFTFNIVPMRRALRQSFNYGKEFFDYESYDK